MYNGYPDPITSAVVVIPGLGRSGMLMYFVVMSCHFVRLNKFSGFYPSPNCAFPSITEPAIHRLPRLGEKPNTLPIFLYFSLTYISFIINIRLYIIIDKSHLSFTYKIII